MRISGGSGGTDAGPWIHLYAVTVGLVVIVPRLALSAWAAWRERSHSSGFRFDLGTPYFRRVLAAFAPTLRRIRVVPYSYTLDESGDRRPRMRSHATCSATQPSWRCDRALSFGAEERRAEGLPRT